MEDRTFRAFLVTEKGKNEFDRGITTRSIADLPEGDVLIRVHYSSLNYKDALSATGNRGVTRNYPHVPGIDAAGVVEKSASPEFAAGEQVIVTGYDLGMNTSGGFGEYIRVPAGWIVKKPDGLSLHDSMVYGTAGFTGALSVYKLTSQGVAPDSGEVLVTGGPGGVGSVAISILAKIGFAVVAVNGRVDEKEYLLGLGANKVIEIEDAVDSSGKPLLKTRWAGAIDTLGGDVLATALKTVSYGGTVTCCGNVRAADFSSSVYPFILRGVSLLGIDSVHCPRDTRIEIWRRLSDEWKIDDFRTVSNEITLEGLDREIDAILHGHHRGRTVVNLGPQ